ncbi:MAG: hypothetical protein KBT66_14465 [Amphritea sp.]|uniref:hypothetical protein n=1 Tax=Amphritea sp. TaxID=1872502 RepID=UPI001B51E71F|nr:hypothetical protein [Amphritea sp.]MBQ0755901.1 hypothetical protein [Amphritea sp.]MBQ0785435.1 hypothetical protein [Amphritea sp.]
MNLDKAKKRIAKCVKRGVKGYPQISLSYFGETADVATEVSVQFVFEEGAEAQEQRFVGKTDVREDEVIQSAIVKIIERAEVSTVLVTDTVSLLG